MNRANPDLPILDELGAEFAAMVGAELGEPAGAVPGHGQRARLPRRGAPERGRGAVRTRRVVGRTSLVLALLCLVGTAALAARFGGGGDGPPADTQPTPLGREAGWEVSGYRDRGRLCIVFTRGGQVGGECAPEPPPDGVTASSARGGPGRLVVGFAGPRVESVAVRVAGRSVVAGTRPPLDPVAARKAGVPDGNRWFLVSVGGATRAPARVVPLGRGQRHLGPAYLDCSLGLVGPACRRQVQSRAESALH